MARAPFKLTQPVVREHPLQRQIAKLLTIEIAPPGHCSPFGVWWCSIDHAHYAGIPATRTRRGIIAGLADFYFEYHGRAHWVELKARDGRLTTAQRELGMEIIKAGGRCGLAHDGDEVLALLDQWNVPRHRRTRIAA